MVILVPIILAVFFFFPFQEYHCILFNSHCSLKEDVLDSQLAVMHRDFNQHGGSICYRTVSKALKNKCLKREGRKRRS